MKQLLICLTAIFGIAIACCQQKFENTDPEGFASLLADTTTIVLDVRTVEEYDDAHIATAINIDIKQDNFVKKVKAILPKNRTIAVYCRSGSLTPNPSPRERGAIYDLSGRRVNCQFSTFNSQLKRKGLYIQNGKKVVKK